MTFRRSIKKLAASIALVGLLFTQFAVSAYACPAMAGKSQQPVAASSESALMPCVMSQDGGTTVSNPGLCRAHCQDGQNNLSSSQTPVAPDFVPAIIVSHAPIDMPRETRKAFHGETAVPPPGPPIHLRNCVFRI